MTKESVESPEAPWELPEHRIVQFRPKRTDYCVAIFVINEGERLLAQLGKMEDIAERIDILVADGGSTDGSTSHEVLSAQRVRALLVKEGAGELGAQIRMGFAYALTQGYEGIVTIDGNDKDDTSAIPSFVKALEEGYDHIQGSRFIRGGVHVNTPPLRLWAIKLIHAPLVSLAAGFRYTDTTNGFRAYSRKFLLDPKVAPFRDVFSAYELHYYLAIQAPRLGYRVKELPVTRSYPSTGAVPTKIRSLSGYTLLLRNLLGACFHRYDPPADA